MPPPSEMPHRRAELLAELFLQDLNATFVARPQDDLGYDFFAGFNNGRGGVNMVAVEVKGTEREVKARFPVPWDQLDRLIHSNVPALLLVVNVKQSRVYWSWLPEMSKGASGAAMAQVPVRPSTPDSTKELRKFLRA